MKGRVLFVVILFFSFVLLLAVQKPFFMWYNASLAEGTDFGDWLAVIWHGLSLDMTVAGYLTLVPLLMCGISVWWNGDFWVKAIRIYIIIIAVIVGSVFALDMALYSYWGFRLDSTIWFYLRSPKDAMASVTLWEGISQVVVGLVYAAIFYFFIDRLVIPFFEGTRPRNRELTTVVVAVMGGLLFLPIRGGVLQSTANEARVYFSTNQFLNHSAVNPVFSLLSSTLRDNTFADQYRYMDEELRKQYFEGLVCNSVTEGPSGILAADRPDIVMVILESFSGNLMGAVEEGRAVVPNLERLAAEGIYFSDIYGNSFRTDKGLVAILNAYPAQPTTSIMKFPRKSHNLPSIAAKLKAEGYMNSVYYGGDIDFTNMRSYFYGSGYDRVVGHTAVKGYDKMGKWGYNDQVMFEYVAGELERTEQSPAFVTFLTLSSHEPFDVPYDEFTDPYVNSAAFTDHWLGVFVERLKATPRWENTLLILVADHSFRYPRGTVRSTPEYQHIPMVWHGGVLRKKGIEVSATGTQVDIAATLLQQMGIGHSEFTYSNDLFNDDCPRYAFYTFNNGFGFIDSTGITQWDCTADRPVDVRGAEGHQMRTLKGKAYLQTLMQDFDDR